MGNCLALCKPNSDSSTTDSMPNQGKVVRVAKPDGKILEFSTPIHVKNILTNFSAYYVSVSKKTTESLSPDHELKAGRLYYLLPSLDSPPNIGNMEIESGVKRIKVVITKQQLEQLVTKQVTLEDILSEVKTVSVNLPNNLKQKLDSIPEENE